MHRNKKFEATGTAELTTFRNKKVTSGGGRSKKKNHLSVPATTAGFLYCETGRTLTDRVNLNEMPIRCIQ